MSQLNELEIGLGERIRYLLYQPHDYSSFLIETGELLERLWEKEIKLIEVTVDEGVATGLTLHGALKYRNRTYDSGLEFREILRCFFNGYNDGVPPEQTSQFIDHLRQSFLDNSRQDFQP